VTLISVNDQLLALKETEYIKCDNLYYVNLTVQASSNTGHSSHTLLQSNNV